MNIFHVWENLVRGQVTLGERAFGQILTLSDYPSYDLNAEVPMLIWPTIFQIFACNWLQRVFGFNVVYEGILISIMPQKLKY